MGQGSVQDSLEAGVKKIQEESGGDWSKAIYLMATQVELETLALNLCSNVVRDDQTEVANPQMFDQIYAQNLGELAEVLVEVARVNGFLPTGGIGSISDRLISLADRLQVNVNLSELEKSGE
jgi:hypothetical protein